MAESQHIACQVCGVVCLDANVLDKHLAAAKRREAAGYPHTADDALHGILANVGEVRWPTNA